MDHIYVHKVKYYETDRMGITHHSNYPRFMEEARVDFLDAIGYSFDKMEESGVSSPIVSISCEYKSPTTFADEIEIHVNVTEMSPLKLHIAYTMYCKGKLVLKATSVHCFLDAKTGHPLKYLEHFPGFEDILKNYVPGV